MAELLRAPLDLLLVEDSGAEVELTLRTLARSGAGARIGVAHDGEEALDFLLGRGAYQQRSLPSLPKLILLGLRLPGRPGWEILTELRRHPRTAMLPVVILSSSADPAEITRSYQLGANGFVHKPVKYEAFAQVLSQISGFWLDANRTGGGQAD